MSETSTGEGAPSVLMPKELEWSSFILLSAAQTTERIIAECMEQSPPTESIASQWFQSRAEDRVSRHVMDAFLTVEYACLSASDHLRALNTLVRANPIRTASMVTLTRATVEAYAKAWRFLTQPSVEALLHWHLSSRYEEYKYSERFGETLRTLDGDQVDAAEQRKTVLDELQRLGLPKPVRMDMTAAVSDLLDAGHKSDEGRRTYSGLSSVAHAEKNGLGNFLSFDSERSRVSLQPSREALVGLLATALIAAIEVLESLVRHFGSQPRHSAIVDTMVERTAVAMLKLFGEAKQAAREAATPTVSPIKAEVRSPAKATGDRAADESQHPPRAKS